MSWNLTRRQLRIAVFGAAAVFVGASIYWTSVPEQPGLPQEGLAATASHAAPLTDVALTLPRTPPEAPTADPEESTVAEYTFDKYQFLLDDLRYLQASEVERLRRALLARERLAGEVATARPGSDSAQALAKAEDQIRSMLHPADYATYESLRESDLELFKLNEYAGGISNVAPLSVDDRKSILKTKLAYKERFRQLLLDSGLQRKDLSAAEREYAYSVTSRALDDYRRSYLQEVRQYLTNEEQYALLSNYETTEFEAELTRLQAMVRGGS